MSYQQLSTALAEELPEKKVFEALLAILAEGNQSVELDEEWVSVPVDIPLELVSRSLNTSAHVLPFGAYRATVAVGGVKQLEHGIITPGVCFATLHFNTSAELVTVDFWENWVSSSAQL